jgi:hypothetical protein
VASEGTDSGCNDMRSQSDNEDSRAVRVALPVDDWITHHRGGDGAEERFGVVLLACTLHRSRRSVLSSASEQGGTAPRGGGVRWRWKFEKSRRDDAHAYPTYRVNTVGSF